MLPTERPVPRLPGSGETHRSGGAATRGGPFPEPRDPSARHGSAKARRCSAGLGSTRSGSPAATRGAERSGAQKPAEAVTRSGRGQWRAEERAPAAPGRCRSGQSSSFGRATGGRPRAGGSAGARPRSPAAPSPASGGAQPPAPVRARRARPAAAVGPQDAKTQSGEGLALEEGAGGVSGRRRRSRAGLGCRSQAQNYRGDSLLQSGQTYRCGQGVRPGTTGTDSSSGSDGFGLEAAVTD